MDSAELLQTGRLDEALAALQAEVRQRPQDAELRARLFGLECVLGRWEKGMAHLQTMASLSSEWVLAAHVYRALIVCEVSRGEVFAGKRKPVFIGEPPPWAGWYAAAFGLEAEGKAEEAWKLRSQAWEAAPDCPATVNGQAGGPWTDSDQRLGHVLEVFVQGSYYWIPFTQLQRFTTNKPEVLADAVWLPAKLLLATNTEMDAYLPVRYPGTELSEDGSLRLAQRTEWRQVPGGGCVPVGQKFFDNDTEGVALLECRSVEFEPRGAGSS